MSVTGIIIAGGSSTRMGTRKALLTYNGKRLINYSIDALKNICDTILISANDELFNVFGYRVIRDRILNRGPMEGIATALEVSETRLNLVLSCDIPCIREEVLRAILYYAEGYDIITASANGRFPEPLIACYNKSVVTEMEKMIQWNNFKLFHLLSRVNLHLVEPGNLAFPYKAEWLRNVNTPSDLARLKCN